MKKLLALLLCALPVMWANACTSAANGNWNSASSWSNCGGVFPVDGDTVTVTHNITVIVDTTVGNSPADAVGTIPTLPVIDLQNTNGTSSNGQLTINGGVTFRVKGSIKVTGNYSPQHAPTVNFQPGSIFIFDNTANPTAVYRFYSQNEDATTFLNAPGTAWTAGHYVTMYGRDPGCASCTGAILFSENATYGTGKWVTFRSNFVYTRFWYFGSPTDAYRAVYGACLSSINTPPQQFYLINTEWHNSSGTDGSYSAGYPCPATDFQVLYLKALNSTTASNKGWWDFRPSGTRNSGKSRIAQYIYLDRGFNGGPTFQDFTTVSYIVADGQQNAFGPTSNLASSAAAASVDHFLVRAAPGWSDSFFFGSTSYALLAIDGGVGNVHSIFTQHFASGSYNWVIDHAIWQHGDTGSSDTDAFEQAAGTGITTAWNYLLMLPNAAQPQYTSHTVNVWGSTATIWSRYNHAVFAFGKGHDGSGFLGSMYYGEQAGCGSGSAGAIGVKNSILWNPNSSAGESPIYGYASAACPLNSLVANVFDPAQIHHNNVWNYGTNSTRWTSVVTGCGGINCTSYNTPYDAPMTGTAPGAGDRYVAPRFLWQKQGLTAPGPREWAHTLHGADITTGESSTQVHFGTTFALFRNAVINDTTTTAGMKGLIDEMFAWIYTEWASTNPALKGAVG
jgi:hypothetical protein